MLVVTILAENRLTLCGFERYLAFHPAIRTFYLEELLGLAPVVSPVSSVCHV